MRINNETQNPVATLEIVEYRPFPRPPDYEITCDFWALRDAIKREAALIAQPPEIPAFIAGQTKPGTFAVWLK